MLWISFYSFLLLLFWVYFICNVQIFWRYICHMHVFIFSISHFLHSFFVLCDVCLLLLYFAHPAYVLHTFIKFSFIFISLFNKPIVVWCCTCHSFMHPFTLILFLVCDSLLSPVALFYNNNPIPLHESFILSFCKCCAMNTEWPQFE